MFAQHDRPFRIETPLGDDVFLVESFTGVEEISKPFVFHIRMVSENPNPGVDGLLRQAGTLSIRLHTDKYRRIPGYFRSIAERGESQDGKAPGSQLRLYLFEAELVPLLWFESLTTDCRVFTEQTVPEIVEKVLRGKLQYRLALQRDSYPKRDFCVQYRESNLQFLSRLLEEEGIYYFFEQMQNTHCLVLADSTSAIKPCDQKLAKIGVLGNWEEEQYREDVVENLDRLQRVISDRVTLRDYDFEKPAQHPEGEAGKERQSERYDYPGKFKTSDEGGRQARLRMEEAAAHGVLTQGVSACRRFTAGYRFQLKGHYRDDFNQEYTLARVEHSGRQSLETGDGRVTDYRNRMQVIPKRTVFRPKRETPKPVIAGTQTAVVVGGANEEIFVDAYGRVRVQFHWDRWSKQYSESSYWVRVSQAWAGAGWGSLQLPRVGQEVVVEFEEGDPDRPLVTGRVYNKEQIVPLNLPAERTQSVMRTRSSPKGQAKNYSEIRVEDARGKEELVIHAERDKSEHVEQDSEEWVGRDRSLTVDRNRMELVKGTTHLTTVGERRERVDKDFSLTIAGDHHEKTGSLFAVEAEKIIHVKAGEKIVIEAGQEISLKASGGFVTIDAGGVTIQGSMVKINSGGSAASGPGASPHAPVKPAVRKEQAAPVAPEPAPPPAKKSAALAAALAKAPKAAAARPAAALALAPSPRLNAFKLPSPGDWLKDHAVFPVVKALSKSPAELDKSIIGRYGSSIPKSAQSPSAASLVHFETTPEFVKEAERRYPTAPPDLWDHVLGYQDPVDNTIHIAQGRYSEHVLVHESIHRYSSQEFQKEFRNFNGLNLNEGTTEYFTRQLQPRGGAGAYELETNVAKTVAAKVGEDTLKSAYFGGDPGAIKKIKDALKL